MTKSLKKYKSTSIIKKRKQNVKEIQFLEAVKWMKELVEWRKLNTSAWRVLCQGKSKPVHAPELA